ncbi:MAG: type II toxin-antitoxin system VapC family toxin [Candidatus Latescibacterota bacterium]
MSAAYYDTGVLLKLYTHEPASGAGQAFVTGRGRALSVTDLHLAEAISALRLKEFRGECTAEQALAAIGSIEEDLRDRILRRVAVDWPAVWIRCQTLARTETARHGTRTLDTLHIASALQLHASELISSDLRQAALARACGLTVVDPCPGRA